MDILDGPEPHRESLIVRRVSGGGEPVVAELDREPGLPREVAEGLEGIAALVVWRDERHVEVGA